MLQKLEDTLTTKINPKLLQPRFLSLYNIDKGFGDLDLGFLVGSVHLIDYNSENLLLGSLRFGTTLVIPGLNSLIGNRKLQTKVNREKKDLAIHSVIYNFRENDFGLHPIEAETLLSNLEERRNRIEGVDNDFKLSNWSWRNIQTPYKCLVKSNLKENLYDVVMNPLSLEVRKFVDKEFNWDFISRVAPEDRTLLVDK
ncbi:MAG: hypothetical protein LAT82_02705 [Nanoarchaeota archaeon]|nr:hypothetical protein [Nanoarchaeota archaeon]